MSHTFTTHDPSSFPDLSEWFSGIILGLCAVVAAHGALHPRIFRSMARPEGQNSGPFTVLLWSRLRRLTGRFDRLLARYRAGTLPSEAVSGRPRRRPASATGGAQGDAQPPVQLPRGRAWLIRFIPYKAAAYGGQLQYLLDNNEETAALIAAAPRRMGRLLRPLCHMLAVPLPAALRRPPRPVAALENPACAETPRLRTPAASWPGLVTRGGEAVVAASESSPGDAAATPA